MRRRAVGLMLGVTVVGCGGSAPRSAAETNPLLAPGSAAMRQDAPARSQARFETSAGVFVVDVTRAWAPGGADRLYNLVRHGFYDGARFFRVVPGFVVQFGISGDTAVAARWREAVIPGRSSRGWRPRRSSPGPACPAR